MQRIGIKVVALVENGTFKFLTSESAPQLPSEKELTGRNLDPYIVCVSEERQTEGRARKALRRIESFKSRKASSHRLSASCECSILEMALGQLTSPSLKIARNPPKLELQRNLLILLFVLGESCRLLC